ncbi:MAG: hypothetical protein P1U40_01155 [Coxiellaceae bacterium]|nr:hypothetical protein [Coxiellaceae bacterium]
MSACTGGYSQLAHQQMALTAAWTAIVLGIVGQLVMLAPYKADFTSGVDDAPSSYFGVIPALSALYISARLLFWHLRKSRDMENVVGVPSTISQLKPKNNKCLSLLTYAFVANRITAISLFTLALPITISSIHQPLVDQSIERCGYFAAECTFNFMKDNMEQVGNIAWGTIALSAAILLCDTVLMLCNKHPSQQQISNEGEIQPLTAAV